MNGRKGETGREAEGRWKGSGSEKSAFFSEAKISLHQNPLWTARQVKVLYTSYLKQGAELYVHSNDDSVDCVVIRQF